MSELASGRVSVGSRAALRFIATYRERVGPRMGARCPHTPSCSAYGEQAFRTHGFVRASAMTVHRIATCHRREPA